MTKATYGADFTKLPGLAGVTRPLSGDGFDDDGRMAVGAARGALLTLADAMPGEGAGAAAAAPVPQALTAVGAPAGLSLSPLGGPDTGAHRLGGGTLQPPGTDEVPRVADPLFGAAVLNPFGLTDVGYRASPIFADIDGDGDLDAFVGNSYGVTQFFRNSGGPSQPAFVADSGIVGLNNVVFSASPTFADIDDDGDLDAFVGDGSGNTQFLRNTGSAGAPAFAPDSSIVGLTNVGFSARPTFADIDGDGDLDAFVGERYGNTQFFRNTGNAGAPAFLAQGSNPFGLSGVGQSASPTFADIDGDGDLDAFIGNNAGETQFFRNTGSVIAPTFTNEGDSPFGLTDVGSFISPTFADIDGDGDLDAFVGASDGVVSYFVNNAPGVKVTPSSGGTTVTEGGVTDSYTLVLNAQPTANVTITLDATNKQVSTSATTLVFTPANWNVAQTVTVTAVNDTVGEGAHTGAIGHAVSSVDAGYTGLAVKPVRVGITDNDLPQVDPGFGAAVPLPFGLTDVGTYASPTFADIDGDGDLDAFIGSKAGDTQFFRNTGSASAPAFASPSSNPFGLASNYFASPAFADIDGDGDLDAFVGNYSGETQFFRNTGSASAPAFTDGGSNPFGLTDLGKSASPTFADIDGDGDLDAFIGYGVTANVTQFFRNTGTASAPTFSAEDSNTFGLTIAGQYTSPTFADIDGDGDLDAFVGVNAGETQFFRNTGSASAPAFTAAVSNPFGLTNLGASAVPTFADIDGDGDLDAFVGNSDGVVRFVVNNGTFVLNAPTAVSVTDTAFDDSFATVSRTLITRGAESATLTFGISGGTDNGGTVSKTSTYGVLTVTKTSGAYSFVPNDAAIEALGSAASASFSITVTNGTFTQSKTLAVNLVQSGTTETPGNDTLTGNSSANRIDGLAGNDSLIGSSGNDTLIGGVGNDTLVGGTGNDSYTVDIATDVISETTTVVTEIDSVSSSVAWTLGSNLERLTLTGSTAINGTGNTLANTITGNTGNNSLLGSSGNDTLNGGIGNDTLNGGTGNDSYTVDIATDVISETTTVVTEIDSVSSGVAWTLGDNLERLTLTGSSAIHGFGNTLANALTGNTGNNSLIGSSGNDTLVGGGGNDTLVGGTGNDSYTVDSGTDLIFETTTVVTEFDSVSSSVTWNLGDNLERLTLTGSSSIAGFGNTLANAITGNTGGNSLIGSGGNDTLVGGGGNDTLTGDTGNDSYTVDSATDTIIESTTVTTEIDSVSSSVSWTLGSNLERLTLTGTSTINGTGNTLANTITGNTGNNSLVGSSGNDTLNGGVGNDTLNGGTGNDSYTVDSSTDLVSETTTVVTEIDSVSSSVAWTLGSYLERLTLTGASTINGTGNTLANTLTGNTGNNSLNGGSGNDTINGGTGNDSLNGSTGNDSLVGGAGNDIYTVDSSTDVISETTTVVTEIDSVSSSVAWTLGNYLERLTLTGSGTINGVGNTLANSITGNTGNNSLTGSSGNDTLNGGLGNDTLTGGTGNDSYTVDVATDLISETTTVVTEIDSVSSSVSWTLGNYLERLTLTGSGTINGVGNTLANTITGNTGNNLLSGGAGNDALTGGIGLDIFRFSSALNGSSNVDTVKDFAAVDDALQLENSIFLKLTTTGVLSSSFFRASTTGTAADSNDYVNYETDTGKLFYDLDGNGAGAAVLFATLTGAPVISSLDIFVT